MQTKIWAISDNRAGHLSQITGVLEALNLPNRLFILNNSILGKLNFSLFPLGVNNKSVKEFKILIGNKNIPNLLIVIGRRNLSLSLFLKRKILLINPNLKLVFLMPPGTTYNKHIDYLFIHKYKIKNSINYKKTKLIPIDFSPSKSLTKNQQKIITKNNLNRPYIGVIIGGKAKGVRWNNKSINDLCNTIINLAKVNNASLLITTSRRTGILESKYIAAKLKIIPNVFWHYNDIEQGKIKNPYLSILSESDVLLVTGESTSMIAECIFLNNQTPVLIYDNKIFIKSRFKKFHKFLYINNYANPVYDGKICIKGIQYIKKAENTSIKIAEFLKTLI